MLTDKGDFVLDPFGGSCVTGEVYERLQRQWVCCEVVEEYIEGAKGRFSPQPTSADADAEYYKIYNSSALWRDISEDESDPIADDGGQSRPAASVHANGKTSDTDVTSNLQLGLFG